MRAIGNSIFLTSLTLLLFALTACQTGSGYNQRQRAPQVAQQAPTPTIEQASATDAAIAATPIDLPPVKVAILLPLSGRDKALGESMLKAAQIALFDVGHSNFELIPGDTKGTESGAEDAARTAINDGAQLILGPVFAANVRAVKPIARRARLNMIGFSTDWTLAGDTTFIMGFLPFDQVQRITSFAAEKNLNRVGVMTPETNYGRVISQAFNRTAPGYGITVTGTSSFSPRSHNLAPTLRQFTRYDARVASNSLDQAPYDAVLMPVGGENARAIANLLSHNDLPPRRVKRLGTGLMDDPALATESNLEGAWFAAPSPRARQNFEQRYRATYGERAPRLSTLAYDATALAAALARQGLSTTGRPAFDHRSLTNPNGFSGIDGIFRFRPDGTAERGLAILEFRRGKIVEIDPAPRTFQQPQRAAGL